MSRQADNLTGWLGGGGGGPEPPHDPWPEHDPWTDNSTPDLPLCESDDSDDSGDDLRKRTFQLVRASAFTTRRIRWLLRDFIPLHMLTVLVGEEGIGKGLWWCWLAAELTNRGVVVMVIATEDDWDTMIRPRLEAAGAHLDRVVTVLRTDDGVGTVTLPTHTPELVELIRESGAAAVFIDPWISVVSGQLKVKDPQDARKALDPLIRLAKSAPVTVIAVVHPNRGEGTLRDRLGLTGVLRQAARSVLWVLTEPDTHTRYVGQDKTNLSPRGLPAHRFTVETTPVLMDDGQLSDVPMFTYLGDDTRSIHQIDDDLRGQRDPRSNPEAWLRVRLSQGPVPTEQLEREATALGISGYRLKELSKSPGIVKRPGGFGGKWEWSLTDETAGQPQSRQSRQSEQSRKTRRVVVPLFACQVCGEPMSVIEPGQTTHPTCEEPR